jgi:hypothetical protein
VERFWAVHLTPTRKLSDRCGRNSDETHQERDEKDGEVPKGVGAYQRRMTGQLEHCYGPSGGKEDDDHPHTATTR